MRFLPIAKNIGQIEQLKIIELAMIIEIQLYEREFVSRKIPIVRLVGYRLIYCACWFFIRT